ncbi:MAG: hypothetical protein WDN08_07065 [Rhizomicrobium sp.]
MRVHFLAVAALAAGLALFAPTLASAAPQDFELTNDTGYDISAVWIGPTSSQDWGDDIMGEDELANGATQPIVFPHGRGATCHWDLKVQYSDDDTTAQWLNFDLCTISSITLSYNRDTGKTWAKWK